MKAYRFKSLAALVLLMFSPILNGQNESNAAAEDKTVSGSYVSLGLNFISDAVYFGRKDSISAPYLYPNVSYFNKTGLYLTGAFSYLTKSNEDRVDLFLGTVGYEISAKKFRGDVSFTKYFFNTDSYNVISEVEADITAVAGYDFKLVEVAFSWVTFFNSDSSSDFFLSSEISHDFMAKTGDFQVSPTMGIFFGSQNFYEQYYINNRFGNGRGQASGTGQGTGGATTPAATTVVLEDSGKFGLMAIEFSAPIWYVKKAFVFSFLPVFVVPQNPATLTVDSTVYKEDLENTFYWMVGLTYKFGN